MLELDKIVGIKDDKAVTTSIKISEVFNKRHDTVLRCINSLECSKEFSDRNFAVAKYLDKQGKLRLMYTITRDGFTFLAMGFTGKKAAQFKEAYINAFNQMENYIKQQEQEEKHWFEKIVLSIIEKQSNEKPLPPNYQLIFDSKPVITVQDNNGNKYVYDKNPKEISEKQKLAQLKFRTPRKIMKKKMEANN